MFRKAVNILTAGSKYRSTRLTGAANKSVNASFCMQGFRCSSALVAQFETAVSKLPAREAVRYQEKNMKWTASNFKAYTDSHANALLEHGFSIGDTIAVWLPDSAEKHVTMLAAAKMGMKVVDIDPKISNVAELRIVLAQAECKALFFDPINDQQDKLLLLRKAIPEFYYYDDTHGQAFHSKHFPHLQYFVHTGFDLEMGCLNYKSLFLRDPEVSAVDALKNQVNDGLPLYAKASAKGGELIWKSQKDVLGTVEWGFADKLIKSEYFESA